MSKVDELLKNEKVEWKKLGDIKEIMVVSPKKKLNRKEYLEEGIYPVIDQGQSFIVGYTNDTNAAFESNKYIVFGDHTESLKYVDFPFVQGADGIKVLKTNEKYINARYLYHVISNFYEIRGEYKRHFSILKETEIPIPSLETQGKIVKILDKFTNYVTKLQAELQAELQARNKQYEYYRDMLLSEDYLRNISGKFVDYKEGYEVRKLTIEDIAKIKNGKDWKTLGSGNTPVYGSGGKMDVYVNKHSYNKPTVLIPRKGSIENIFYVDEPFWNVDTIYYTEIDETKIKPKYFYYFMKTIDLKSLSTNSTRPSLTQSILNKIKINVPPIEIQNKVVEVLDKFQSLLSDTQGLLPEEIEQRQKQYEYYREKLLTFDENMIREREREREYLSNLYLRSLKEAGEIVGIENSIIKYKHLEEICVYSDGTHQTPKYKSNGVPFVSVENIKNIYCINKYISKEDYDLYKYKPEKEDLFMTRIGDIGTCAIVKDDRDMAYYVTLALIKPDREVINSKFLKYYIESKHGRRELNKRILHTANPIKINLNDIGKIKVLVPSLEVQGYLASILDKFDKLVNDINEGLPKEIELRQKQYEYYRERLLNFPK